MHVFIQSFNDVGDDRDVDNLGLLSIPFGEFIHLGLILGMIDSTRLSGFQRIFNDIASRKVLGHEIRGSANVVAFVEIFHPIVIEFNAQDTDSHYRKDSQRACKNEVSLPDHQIGHPITGAAITLAPRLHPEWKNSHQSG